MPDDGARRGAAREEAGEALPEAGVRLPPTVSSPALLDDGPAGASDRRFRQMLYDLLYLESQMREARDRLGVALGVSGPAYAIVMTIARHQGGGGEAEGVRVADVARRLHVTGAFVTAEVNKLVADGLVDKRPDAADRRAVRLSLTRAGEARVRALVPKIRGVNDYFFGDLTAAEFDTLSTIAARFGGRSTALHFDAEAPRP